MANAVIAHRASLAAAVPANAILVHAASVTAATAPATPNAIRIHAVTVTAAAPPATANAIRIHRASITIPGVTGSAPLIDPGPDLVVEPGEVGGLMMRATDVDTAARIKTGVFTQISGPAVTLTTQTTTDGYGVCTFVAPRARTTQTLIIRMTATAAGGMPASKDVTVTVPPWQTWPKQ